MIRIDGQPILTAAAIRAAEEGSGVSAGELMRRAGQGVAVAVARLAGGSEILVLCGPGSNGGDGYVTATALAARGYPVRVAASGESRGGPAIAARDAWLGPVESLPGAVPAPVLVDALFGTGLSRARAVDVGEHLDRLAAQAQLVIAVDLPSGIASDDGALLSDVPCAQLTLALGAVRPAHVLQPAAQRCGTVRLIDIGVPTISDDTVMSPLQLCAPGPADHKYTRGMVAVIAGAMPGAAALAASAAARVAGYVLLLGSATDRLPHAIVRRRWSGEALADPRIGAVLIGPGLGRDDKARAKLDAALASDLPLVLDGDALVQVTLAQLRERPSATILTPHAGEFAKLFGGGSGNKIDRARAAAIASDTTVVFKGADTVVAHPDGRTRVSINGVPWLATAGTGDVLAGIIAGLLSGSHQPFAAATDGVSLHSEAARCAGPAFIADDLIAALPTAIAASL